MDSTSLEARRACIKIVGQIERRMAYLHKIAMMKSWEAPDHDRGSRNELEAIRDWIVHDLLKADFDG